MTEVTVQHVLDFADVLADRHLVASCISSSLDPILLSLDREPDYRQSNSAEKHAVQVNSFCVHYVTEAGWTSVNLEPTNDNYQKVQPLPEQQWLLTRGRAADERDRNAHVYSAHGRLLRSFHAGDGIEDVQTTSPGRIWISYFDEGVFGNTPLGTAGLACLDRRGRPVFRFTDLGADRLIQSMADCYALNVASDRETWLYYYTDFPLVRLVDYRVAGSWRMPIKGSHAFAVDGERVLLGGSYKHKDSLFLLSLGTMRAKKLKPIDERGRGLGPFRAMGRGTCLHLATEGSLYRIELRSL